MAESKTDIKEADNICRFSSLHVMMLDNRLRRFLLNPEKLLKDKIRPGMTVIDIGCGPGIFTGAMAELAGEKGTVIACDVQVEMIEYAKNRYERSSTFGRIKWNVCSPGSLMIKEDAIADFALSFYMVHEVPDRDRLFEEVFRLLKPGGGYLVAEPLFHVSAGAFLRTVQSAKKAGFLAGEIKKTSMGRMVVFAKPVPEDFVGAAFQ